MCTSKSLPFNRFSNLGVGAEHLSGDCDWRSVFDALRCVNGPSIKLLYVTPEKIKASNMLNDAMDTLHRKNQLSRFVIDEAHCVSGWGHDFRPDYCDLKQLKQRFPGIPFMALTATATPRVRADVVSCLVVLKFLLCIHIFFLFFKKHNQ